MTLRQTVIHSSITYTSGVKNETLIVVDIVISRSDLEWASWGKGRHWPCTVSSDVGRRRSAEDCCSPGRSPACERCGLSQPEGPRLETTESWDLLWIDSIVTKTTRTPVGLDFSAAAVPETKPKIFKSKFQTICSEVLCVFLAHRTNVPNFVRLGQIW